MYAIGAVILILGVGIGYSAGAAYTAKNRVARQFPQGMNGRFEGGAMMGSPRGTLRGSSLSGSVISKDEKSITLQTIGGGSRIIFMDPTTVYTKASSGSASLVTTGTNVFVTGNQNPDGSVTAQSIEVR